MEHEQHICKPLGRSGVDGILGSNFRFCWSTERPDSEQGGELQHHCCGSLAQFFQRLGVVSFLFFIPILTTAQESQTENVNKLAEQRNVIFDRIGTPEGLSQGGVTTITQDQQGFIWIGTQEGLNRFDGYDFTSYYHIEEDGSSLSHDSVWSLLSDSQDRLWVGTDSGLNVFQRGTNSFTQFELQVNSEGNETGVYALLEDEIGNIWIGTSLGLSRLSKDGQLINYQHDITDGNSLSRGRVRALHQSSDGTIWVGTELGGLNKLDPQTGRAIHFAHDPNSLNSLSDNYVRSIAEDDDGRLWIATFNGGVSIFYPKAEVWERINSSQSEVYDLGSNRVRTVFKDQSGDIWLGTDGGLNLWRPTTKDFLHYVVDLTNVRSISDNTVFSIFQDKGGVIWVGTFNGINKWNATVETFPHFKQQSTNPTGLTSSSISSFAEVSNGDVWIGTFAGLNRWDESEAKLEALSSDMLGLSDTRVMSLAIQGKALWAGTMSGGVNIIENDLVVATHTTDPHDANSISSNAVSRIYNDSRGQIWLTTYGGGVNKYLGDGKFKRYPDVTNPYGAFSDLRALDILEAGDGTFWIATDGGGVTVLDPESGDTLTFRHKPDDKTTLSSDNVISLLKTQDTIWVGTRDRGMNRYNVLTGAFKRYSKGQGLASDSVYGMLEDGEGRIWISGGKGLSVLDPRTDTFLHYDSTHGLQADDFNSGAYLKLTDGSFLYGGNNGFNAFSPERIRRNEYAPPVRLTSFSKFNKVFELPEPIYETNEIELDYTDFVIGFEFSALDYTAPEKNRFQYMLDGFDPEWVELSGGARQATYTNLDAGEYIFRLRGSNNDGVWSEKGEQVRLIVSPPLWATWWAYAVYVLVTVIAVFQLAQVNARRQRREVEKRYSERLQLYIESLEEATDCILIADRDGKLLYANNAISSIIGWTPSDAVGRSLVSVVFENEKDAEKALLALEEHGRYHSEVVYTGEEGEEIATEVTIAAVRELSEEGHAYVSISRDITRRKAVDVELEAHRRNLEFLVAERTSALEHEIAENKATQVNLANSLEEKELLLKEVHHRVKNNMQVISSLLNIQAETADNKVFANLLGESQQRIKSMSLIHENLYQSDNLLEIDFEDYINMLANSLCRFYSVPGVTILLDINVEDVALDIETAVPCGLILNEIVSNSLKHAFKDNAGPGTISVSFKHSGCNYVLEIRDDGIGLPSDFQLTNNSSMGMEIVSILTQQLDGKIRVLEGDGAGFEIMIPKREKHER
jgi:PAS domain S-box-containing protein